MNIFESIIDYIKGILETSLSNMTGLETIVLGFLFVIAGFLVLVAWVILKKIFKLIALCFVKCKHAKRKKCEKLQCKSCGRNLINCICEKNKNASLSKRLRNYKKAEKELKNK